MARAPAPRRAYVLLLGGGHARAAARVLRASAPEALVVEPPASGVRFFTADGDEGRALDEWYATTDLGEAPPNLLIWHDPELIDWARGVDAEFWVAAPDHATADTYRGQPNVHAVATWDATELARQAAAPAGAPSVAISTDASATRPDPFLLLAGVQPLADPETPPSSSTAIVPVLPKPAPARFGLLRRLLDLLRRRSSAPAGPGLGALLVSAPPLVIAVLGPGGGATHTGSGAALAAVLGEAVRPLSRTVGLVDGHLGDAEAWSALGVNANAATVGRLVEALRQDQRPPRPAYGGSPTVLLYPETPGAKDGYAPADLHRAAEHLRREHLAVVVDLAPDSPEGLDSAAATRAAWLAESDVVVLVAASDQTGLAVAQTRLQSEVLRGKRVVACLVGPAPRPGRDQPDQVALYQTLRSHVARLVELPQDDQGTAALLQRESPQPAAAIQGSYADLARAVIEVASAP